MPFLNTLWTILIAVLIFGFLILIHELGHYLMARMFHVTILEYSIGMGPKALSRVSKKTGIRYSLRWLPFGGYVSMAGEDEETDDPNALNRKPAWQRMIIMAAGSFMNLLLGVILTATLVIGSQSLGTTTIFRFVSDGAATEQAGLQIGDTVKKIGNTDVHIAYDLRYAVMRQGSETTSVTVLRAGKKVVVENVSFPSEIEGGIAYGMTDFYLTAAPKTLFTVIKQTFYQSLTSVKMIWDSLIDMVTGRVGLEQVSGPVGVTEAIGEAAKEGTSNLLFLSALIAINLGVFNLLPLPALDGGRIVFLLIEMLRRKPIKPEYEGYIHFAGLALLMLLMIVITFKDVLGLFS